MSFTRDDVVQHVKMGVVGVIIGAGKKLDGEVIYIAEIPGRNEFTFFIGTENQLIPIRVDNRPAKMARVGLELEIYLEAR